MRPKAFALFQALKTPSKDGEDETREIGLKQQPELEINAGFELELFRLGLMSTAVCSLQHVASVSHSIP